MAMKRYVVLLSIIMCIVVTKALAHDIEAENADGVTIYYNYINNKNELSVCGLEKSYSGSVNIPESVTFTNRIIIVTKIGSDAFKGYTRLTSVTIPNSVTIM